MTSFEEGSDADVNLEMIPALRQQDTWIEAAMAA
jgi:hypothetical protein